VVNRPVLRAAAVETASLGAAVLAGAGSGAFGSLAEAQQRMGHVLNRHDPDPGLAEQYEALYARYRGFETDVLRSTVYAG
jgi:sugar (pentulose or hexulose) kinase